MKIYALTLLIFMGMQAGSDQSTFKKLLTSKEGKIISSALALLGAATGVGISYYFWNKRSGKGNEKKKDVIKSDIWLQHDGSVHINKAENWHDCTPLSIPDQLSGNMTVMARDIGTGKREFRICVFNVGRCHISLNDFQNTHITTIKNWVSTDGYWSDKKKNTSIILDFYTGRATDYYAKKDNVKLRSSKKI